MSTAMLKAQTDRRVCKRPKVGEHVMTNVGPARVTSVAQQGRRLWVHTETHGDEVIERAAEGHWTVAVPGRCEGEPLALEHKPAGFYRANRYHYAGWIWAIEGQYGRIGDSTWRTCETCGESVREGECAVRQWGDRSPRSRYQTWNPPKADIEAGKRDGWAHLRCRPEAFETNDTALPLTDTEKVSVFKLRGRKPVSVAQALRANGFTLELDRKVRKAATAYMAGATAIDELAAAMTEDRYGKPRQWDKDYAGAVIGLLRGGGAEQLGLRLIEERKAS